MALKIFAGILAAILLLLFVGPVVVKLKDVALLCVVLIGLVMMVVDIWHALRSRED